MTTKNTTLTIPIAILKLNEWVEICVNGRINDDNNIEIPPIIKTSFLLCFLCLVLTFKLLYSSSVNLQTFNGNQFKNGKM